MEELLRKLYHTDKLSLSEIGKIINLTHSGVLRRMRKYEIPRRSSAEACQGKFNKHRGISDIKNRKYEMNENIFDLLAFESAWALGFIAADGCIESDNCYSICQAEIEPLEKIKKIIGTTKPIEFRINTGYSNGPYYRLRINCVKHVLAMSKFNLTPKKSLTLNLPILPDKYFWHFVRGYFDGDGSIYKLKRKRKVSISFIGAIPFITSLKESISKKLSIFEPKTDMYHKNVARVTWSAKEDVKNIGKAIYENSTDATRLDRKYQRYINYFFRKEEPCSV